jgi:hypothetical protein
MKDGNYTKLVEPLSRESDERILEWLRQREAGVSPNKIGRDFGVDHKTVRDITDRIYAAELDE